MPVKFEAISRLGADILAHVCQQLDSLALRSPLSVKKAFISELAAWLEQLPAISAIFAGISYLSFKMLTVSNSKSKNTYFTVLKSAIHK